MKPFHTYRDGLPPTPGIFATALSVDEANTPLRIGDIVRDVVSTCSGLVCGIFDDVIVILIDDAGKGREHAIGDFVAVGSCYCRIIGHAYSALAEVARIEAAAAANVSKDEQNVDPAAGQG